MDDLIKTSAEALEQEALPRFHEAHTSDEAAQSSTLAKKVEASEAKPKSPAEWAYDRFILYLQNFEEQLDNEHEVAMGFTGGDAGVLRIEGMGFFDPDMITFYGTDQSGTKTQLVQHVSQLNVMLRALPKAVEKDEPPKRIGFRLAQKTTPA